MVKGYNTPQEEEIKEEEDNIVDFKPKLVAVGGKEPPSEFNNWLDKLDVGAVFTAQDKLATSPQQPNYFMLALFKIGGRDGKVTFLQSQDNPGGFPVNTQRFCNRFDLFETIDTYVEEGQQQTVLQETEKADGNGDRIQGD